MCESPWFAIILIEYFLYRMIWFLKIDEQIALSLCWRQEYTVPRQTWQKIQPVDQVIKNMIKRNTFPFFFKCELYSNVLIERMELVKIGSIINTVYQYLGPQSDFETEKPPRVLTHPYSVTVMYTAIKPLTFSSFQWWRYSRTGARTTAHNYWVDWKYVLYLNASRTWNIPSIPYQGIPAFLSGDPFALFC